MNRPLAMIATAAVLAGCTPEAPDGSPSAAEGNRLRLVTLSPHLAELVHAAGAGELLVGVSAYSDFPPEVRTLPQIGDAFLVDEERLALLEPDIVFAWASGTPDRTVAKLRGRGFHVEVLQTRHLEDVATALRRIGVLTGRQSVADTAASSFRSELDRLRQLYAEREPISVFYQISARPLYTVNGDHYVSELIGLCGGTNVFAGLSELAPLVAAESVLARDPEAIIAGGAPKADGNRDDFDIWRRWKHLAATRLDNFFLVNADLLGRATPRLTQSGAAICHHLEQAREARAGRGRASYPDPSGIRGSGRAPFP